MPAPCFTMKKNYSNCSSWPRQGGLKKAMQSSPVKEPAPTAALQTCPAPLHHTNERSSRRFLKAVLAQVGDAGRASSPPRGDSAQTDRPPLSMPSRAITTTCSRTPPHRQPGTHRSPPTALLLALPGKENSTSKLTRAPVAVQPKHLSISI